MTSIKEILIVGMFLLLPISVMSFGCPHCTTLKMNCFRDDPITVPLGGNTWRSGKGRNGGQVTNNGIENWTDQNVSFITYVRVNKPGSFKVGLDAEAPSGKSTLEVSINNKKKSVVLSSGNNKAVNVGEWQIKDTGYVAVHLKGLSKTGEVFANIQSLNLSGSAIDAQTAYVKNNQGNFFYWGRRGPSVHLNYKIPDDVNVSWFYTEITVPEGNDILGSYFEADGFGQGYFGMQVNSPTTRHILFSLWSPYKTQNPEDIPDSLKIQLISKGSGVHAGKFGGEGSGGQSYLNFMWKAGNTYRFLLHCQPQDNDHTIFTAYFYAPEEGKWHLIASFSRPKTHTYLKGLYSFLENFDPHQGDITRMAEYGNQWIRTDKGKWMELTKAIFTTDNTGNKGYRMDYAGGVKGDQFYLQNCGFFSNYTKADTWLERPATEKKPPIDLDTLPGQ